MNEDIKNALRILRSGGIVGLPTETVYGLAASLDSEEGLKAIFSTKERPLFDPLIVHISSTEQWPALVRGLPEPAKVLARAFWPGPLTIVLPKSDRVPDLVTSGLKTVAVRQPAHPVAQKVIEALGSPIAAPSANKFGKTSPTRKEHVEREFPGLFVLEGGETEVGIESTVIQIDETSKGFQVWILRPGTITESEIKRVLDTEDFPEVPVARAESAASPGHLKYHYQPAHPLYVLKGDATFDHSSGKTGWEISLTKDPLEAARTLYGKFHEGSEKQVDYLFLRWLPDFQGELWDAIWDRVKKAATEVIGS